ncbi:MAG: hypothetical protein R3E84_16030 [Pseudomonadales bacterium]
MLTTSRASRRLLCVVLSFGLFGCKDPIGTTCSFEGSGFTASDNCRHRCLDTRSIQCPDGREIRPRMCSGAPGCEPGTCAANEVCYHVADPFEVESYCLPANVCGPLDADALADWSTHSMEHAAGLRAESAARKARALEHTSVPGPVLENTP